VKNTGGGNKGKKGARKNMGGGGGGARGVRRIQEEGEVYAVVTKILGGGICLVELAPSGRSCQCVIRGKFRGRNKSANTISGGVWVLVGLRDWEVRAGEMLKADLLEVYSRADQDRLKQLESNSVLPGGSKGAAEEEDIFDRADEWQNEMENQITEELGQKGGMGAGFLEADEEIDINDI